MAASASAAPVASATLACVVSIVVRLQLAIMLALAPLTFAVFDGLSLAGLCGQSHRDSARVVRAGAAGAGRRARGAGRAGVEPRLLRCRGALCTKLPGPGLTWAADGESRAVARYAVACGGSRSQRWRRWCCCGAGRWPLRCVGRLRRAAAGVRAARMARARRGARERPRRRPRLGCAGVHAFACAAVRHGRQLEHARRAPAATGAAGARCARAPRASTCWCCRHSIEDRAHGAALLAFEREVRDACGWVAAGRPPRCPFDALHRFGVSLGRCGFQSFRGGRWRALLRAARVGGRARHFARRRSRCRRGARVGCACRTRRARERRGAHEPAGEFARLGARVDRSERRGTGDRYRRYRRFTLPRRDARPLAPIGRRASSTRGATAGSSSG